MSGGGQVSQHLSDRPLAEALERSIAQLAHALASDAEHFADLVQGVLAIRLEAEIEAENLGVARGKGEECTLDSCD